MALKIIQKESSPITIYCDHILKISIYVLVFLLPIFFVPWTYDVGDFNKQALLIIFSLVASGAWLVKTLVSGKLTIKVNKITIAMGGFLLVYLVSVIFSVVKYNSFWGFGQFSSQAFISVLSLAMVYFLVSNNFSEKEISKSFFILSISSSIVMLFGILQLLALHIIPLNFAQSNNFNTVGSLGSLGLFAVSLSPLFIMGLITAKKWLRALYIFNIALVFFIALLINYNFVWLVLLAASFLLIIFWVMRREMFDARWMFLPVFFFIVSLFFLMVSPQITWLPQNSVEVSLSNKSNIAIDMQALKSFPIVGSGPATFSYDFAKYKNQDFNNTYLWNVNFNSGASKVLTSVAELGILGLLFLLALMALPLFYGVKYVIYENSKQELQNLPLVATSLLVLASLTLAAFVSNTNLTLDFIYYFFIAMLVALIVKNVKTYAIKSSSLMTLVVISVCTLFFFCALGMLFLEAQRYMANMNYHKALASFSEGKKDDSLAYLKTAADNGSSDLYFNQLALYSLSKLQDEISNPSTENQDFQKAKLQALISDAVHASDSAIAINPQNYDNWSTRGYVCQNLIGIFTDAPDCAIKSFDQAIMLNPYNPYFLLQQGNIYLSEAVNLPKDQLQNKDSLLSQAKEKYAKAIVLKQDYSLPYFQTALILKLEGNNTEAASFLQNAQKYNQNDAALFFQIGLIYYQDKNWTLAQVNFQNALQLVGNYANALYYAGLTYDKQGQKTNAISAFTKLLELNVKKEDIQKILDNINSGKGALDGLVQQPPAEPVSEETVIPKTKK